VIQTSLFSGGSFLNPEGIPLSPVLPDREESSDVLLAADSGPEEPIEVEVVQEPSEPVVHYSEKAWIAEQLAGLQTGIVLCKLGTKAVVAYPGSFTAAAKLEEYLLPAPTQKKVSKEESAKRRQENLEKELLNTTLLTHENLSGEHMVLRAFWKNFPSKKSGTAVHFPIALAMAPAIEESFLYQHLVHSGFQVVVSPSLSNWITKQQKRIERDNTNFNLPDEIDSRPLFDRVERASVLLCIASDDAKKIFAGQKYIVCSLYENAKEDYVGIKQLGGNGEMIKWTSLDADMENFFTLEDDNSLIYKPEESITVRYSNEIHAAQKKLEALPFKNDLFGHVKYDAVQASIKNNIYLGYPMRMGKTSLTVGISEIWNPKKRDGSSQPILVVTPPNVRQYFKGELERLGIHDYTLVNDFADLEKPGKYKLVTYNWLKNKRDWNLGSHGYIYPVVAKCPHCNQDLVRDRHSTPVRSTTLMNACSYVHDYAAWEDNYYGWSCNNPDCSNRGYVDFGRKQHWSCIIEYLVSFKYNENKYGTVQAQVDHELRKLFFSDGRACSQCGYTERSWVPAKARRLKKHKFGAVIVDELHNMAPGRSTAQGAAVLALRAKRRIGLTGTLMPNRPTDPYWPLHWLFVGGSHRFPYSGSGSRGLLLYGRHFQEVAYLHDQAKGATKVQKLPYLRSPKRFRRMMAPKMIRRTYSDPLVQTSLTEAGLVNPTVTITPVMVNAHPKQLTLLDKTLDAFLQEYAGYLEELKKQSTESGKLVLPNSARVFPMMMRMRIAATVPDYVNDKMKALGLPDFYDGPIGGAKLNAIREQVWSTRQAGGKVVIFSFFKKQRANLASALEFFNPILFDNTWDEEKRFAAQAQFRDDPDMGVFICNLYSLAEGADLAPSKGDVSCICVDLPWNPGKAQQAWSRILKPVSEPRTCPVYLYLVKNSIDEHMYTTFYGKTIASEQAFDGRIISKAEKKVDVGWFVDQVAKSKEAIQEALLEAGESETLYVPMNQMVDFSDYEDVA
jgi:hypothetical protein